MPDDAELEEAMVVLYVLILGDALPTFTARSIAHHPMFRKAPWSAALRQRLEQSPDSVVAEVAALIADLAAEGLVRRMRPPKNRRHVRTSWKLTTAGRIAKQALLEAAVDGMARQDGDA